MIVIALDSVGMHTQLIKVAHVFLAFCLKQIAFNLFVF